MSTVPTLRTHTLTETEEAVVFGCLNLVAENAALLGLTVNTLIHVAAVRDRFQPQEDQ